MWWVCVLFDNLWFDCEVESVVCDGCVLCVMILYGVVCIVNFVVGVGLCLIVFVCVWLYLGVDVLYLL